jgi:MFS family permease
MIKIHPELAKNPGILVAAVLGLTIGMLSGLFYSMGTLIPVWEVEFGWSRGDMSLSLTFVTLALFLFGTTAGHLGDKFGAATVGGLSLAIYGGLLILLAAFMTELWQLWVGYVVLAIVGAGSTAIVLIRPIAAVFDARRGLAMGITMTGAGIAGFWVPQFVAFMIEFDGWRTAMMALGALAILVAPIVWFGFREQKGEAATKVVEEVGPEFSEAIRSQTFWILSLMAIAMSLGVGGLVVHFVPMFTDLGADGVRAAQIASILGLSSVVGRIGVGMLLDRISAPLVALGTLVLAAFGVMLLYLFGLQYAPLAVALVGLAAGAEVDLIAYLCSRQFGTRSYGKIYGWQYSVFVMGYGFSPFLVGLARDHFGNYNFALLASASAVAIAGLVAPMLRSKPDFQASEMGGGTLSEA